MIHEYNKTLLPPPVKHHLNLLLSVFCPYIEYVCHVMIIHKWPYILCCMGTIVKYIFENMSIEHKYLRYQITTWYSVVQEGAAQSFQPGPVTFNLNSFVYKIYPYQVDSTR